MPSLRTFSEEETIQAGKKLAPLLRGVVLLSGDLGAGKTALVRGIVTGIPGTAVQEVSSPTFTLIHDYGAGVFHLDLYRLDTEHEIRSLGLEDLFANAYLVLIEWGEKLGLLAPSQYMAIHIEHAGDNKRVIYISTHEDHLAAGNRPT